MKRAAVLKLRLRQDEKARAIEAAVRAGLTLSEFVRAAIRVATQIDSPQVGGHESPAWQKQPRPPRPPLHRV